MRKILILGIIHILMCYCTKDMGNYEYNDINSIIIGNLPTDYNDPKVVFVGDSLHLHPSYEFENSDDYSKLQYLWIFDKDTIANTKDLNTVVLLSPRNRVYGSYRVLDTTTGVEYISEFYLSIKASFENGWLFLCEKQNGHGQLNFFRPENKATGIKERLVIDGYLTANGSELSKKPKSMRHHFLPMTSMYLFDNQINIICQGEPDMSIEIDGNNFKHVIKNKDEFIDNAPPANFMPQATFNSSEGYSIMSNGKLYARARRDGDPFQEGYFTNFPVRPIAPLKDNYELSPFMLPFNVNEPFAALLFDKKNKSYMLTTGLRLLPVAYDNDTVKAFYPMEMDKDLITVHRISRSSHDFMSGGEFISILKDNNGTLWQQRFNVTPPAFGGGFGTIEESLFGGEGYGENSVICSAIMTSYLYYTSNDRQKLYAYNFITKISREIELTIDGEITCLHIDNKDKELIVCTDKNYNGNVYWISVELGNEGKIINKILNRMGRIVDIQFKPGSWFY